MSNVLKIKKDEESFVFLSRDGLTVRDLQTNYSQNPFTQPSSHVQIAIQSDQFGNEMAATENTLILTTFSNDKLIRPEYILQSDLTGSQKIEQLSTLEKYYLGSLQLQEEICRDTPDLISINNSELVPEKFMLAANHTAGLGNEDIPLYSMFRCQKNSDWFSEVPGAFLAQEKARIISVSLQGDTYSVLADWDENFINGCDIVYKRPGIKNRIGSAQEFTPTEIAGAILNPSNPLTEPAEETKVFGIQPKIGEFAVNNFFKFAVQEQFVGPIDLKSLGINVFIESFNLESQNDVVVYYRLINALQNKNYSVNIYNSNTLIYHGQLKLSGGKLIIPDYLKKPNFLYVEVFENENKKIFQKELVSYRYIGSSYNGISLRDTREVPGELEFDIELSVSETDIWIPAEKSLDDIDLSNSTTDVQIKDGQLIYQVVITKIFDGKFFDEEVIFVNRNLDGFAIEGTDGANFNVVKEDDNKRLITYRTALPQGGSVVVLANVRVYPVSMYLYEKKDFFLEYIDMIERGQAVIPKRKKLFFLDHPSNAIKISPYFNADTGENVRFLHKTGTSKSGIVVYENHELSYAAIPVSSINRFEEAISVSVTQKILYYESNREGSIHPQVLPYQVIDIEVDDELKPQISGIELYSCINAGTNQNKVRIIGKFIPTATIRAVDFSTAALFIGATIANESELIFDPANPPASIKHIDPDLLFSQFGPTKKIGIFYRAVIKRDSFPDINIDSDDVILPSIRPPEPIIYNSIVKLGDFDLQSE